MNMNLAKTSLLLAFALSLTACGGGGGGGGVSQPPVITDPGDTDPDDTDPDDTVNPPVVGPLSTSTADLVTYAQAGTTAGFENGVMRSRNVKSADGVIHNAHYDSLAGSTNGRVTYVNSDGEAIYRLVGDTPTSVTAPSGVYTGEIDMSWKDGADDDLHTASGRMAIVLNLQSGSASVDSIVDDNANNVIQVIGSANVVGGALKGDAMTVLVGDAEGANIRNETGTLDGVIASGTDSSAIFGTVGSSNTANGWEMTGGFSTGFDQEHTDQLP